jgi:hypothetical protein
MTGILKALLIIYGVILVVLGIGLVIFPEQTASSLLSFDNLASSAKLFAGMLGAVYIAVGIYLAAAGGDPLRHISWVKFIILKIGLSLAFIVYALSRSYVETNALNISMLVVDFIFGLAFLITYPWRSTRTVLPKS